MATTTLDGVRFLEIKAIQDHSINGFQNVESSAALETFKRNLSHAHRIHRPRINIHIAVSICKEACAIQCAGGASQRIQSAMEKDLFELATRLAHQLPASRLRVVLVSFQLHGKRQFKKKISFNIIMIETGSYEND